jgi:hypothetical protein
MDDFFARVSEDLVGRLTGPLTLRLFLQPAMAIFLAIRAGLQDARAGRAPFFWSLATDPAHRRELLTDGWKSVAKVFIAAVILDGVYQFIALGWFYPGEALLVAFILAIVPYVLIRGPVNRLARGNQRTARGTLRP